MANAPSVLIVDDNPPDIELSRRVLQQSGQYGRIFSSTEPRKALDLLRNFSASREAHGEDFPPLLVLLDINMPQMNGFEFLEAYQRLLPGIPFEFRSDRFFVISGSPRDLDRQHASEFPFVRGYIEKPLSMERAVEIAVECDRRASHQPDHSFDVFIDNSPDLLCTASTDGYFKWLNRRWTEALGYSEEVLLNTPFIDFVHPDDVDITLAEVMKLAEGRPTVQFVNRYRRADGAWLTLEWSAMPGPHGELYSIARNITDRAKTVRNHNLLTLAQAISKTGHWHVDLVNETVSWSDEIYRIHGVTRENHTPTLASGIEAYHPDDQQKVATHVERAISEKLPFDFELRLVRPSGEVRLVHCLGQPELDDHQRVIGVFGVFRDITDDERVRRQEEFAHIAAHDLREPIRTMNSYLEILHEEGAADLPEPLPEYFSYVTDAAQRMRDLVYGILDLTNAGQEFTIVPVDLVATLAHVVHDLGTRIAEAGATLDVDVSGLVLSDEVRLRRVFMNLIGNAIKFSTGQPQVRVSSKAKDGRILICVEDDGIGIEPQYHERVFEPFRRLNPQHDYAGSGLGLSIVARIVRECGGEVCIDSEPGVGSKLYVSLLEAKSG